MYATEYGVFDDSISTHQFNKNVENIVTYILKKYSKKGGDWYIIFINY
jgi:hypothetical protein